MTSYNSDRDRIRVQVASPERGIVAAFDSLGVKVHRDFYKDVTAWITLAEYLNLYNVYSLLILTFLALPPDPAASAAAISLWTVFSLVIFFSLGSQKDVIDEQLSNLVKVDVVDEELRDIATHDGPMRKIAEKTRKKVINVMAEFVVWTALVLLICTTADLRNYEAWMIFPAFILACFAPLLNLAPSKEICCGTMNYDVYVVLSFIQQLLIELSFVRGILALSDFDMYGKVCLPLADPSVTCPLFTEGPVGASVLRKGGFLYPLFFAIPVFSTVIICLLRFRVRFRGSSARVDVNVFNPDPVRVVL